MRKASHHKQGNDSGGIEAMNTYELTAHQMAVLLLTNSAVVDIVDSGRITPDTLEELKYLQPKLSDIIENADT